MYVKVVQLLEITPYTKIAVAREESQKLLKIDIQCQYKISGQRNNVMNILESSIIVPQSNGGVKIVLSDFLTAMSLS